MVFFEYLVYVYNVLWSYPPSFPPFRSWRALPTCCRPRSYSVFRSESFRSWFSTACFLNHKLPGSYLLSIVVCNSKYTEHLTVCFCVQNWYRQHKKGGEDQPPGGVPAIQTSQTAPTLGQQVGIKSVIPKEAGDRQEDRAGQEWSQRLTEMSHFNLR